MSSKVFQGSFPSAAYTGLTGASTSYFFKMGQGGGNSTITTEANQQNTERFNGTYSRAGIYITANSRLTAGTLRSRKNNGNGAQSASIIASTTGRFEDASNTDSVVATDTFGLVMVNGTGTAAITVNNAYCCYEATSAMRNHMNAEGVSTFPTAAANSTTYINQPTGGMSAAFSTSGSDSSAPIRAAGTATNFNIRVTANTRSTTTTAGTRFANTTIGNNIVSIATTLTGIFEDTTNSDTLTNTTLMGYYVATSTGSGSMTIAAMGVIVTSTGNYYDSLLGFTNTVARSLSGTNYSRFIGHTTFYTTESDATVKIPFDGRCSNLRVCAGTLNSVLTVKVRKNGSDGNQSVSTPSSGSGITEDVTNHDDFVDTDLLGLSWTAASASSSNLRGAGLYITPPSVPGGSGTTGLLQVVS